MISIKLRIEKSSDFKLETIRGKTLEANQPLSAYGLGSLFYSWQLRLAHKSINTSPSSLKFSGKPKELNTKFVVDFRLPTIPETKGMHKKSLLIDPEETVGNVINYLCSKLKLNQMNRFELNIDGKVPRHYECLSMFGLGIRFKSCTIQVNIRRSSIGTSTTQGNYLIIIK
jgi:hypothetical protein